MAKASQVFECWPTKKPGWGLYRGRCPERKDSILREQRTLKWLAARASGLEERALSVDAFVAALPLRQKMLSACKEAATRPQKEVAL